MNNMDWRENHKNTISDFLRFINRKTDEYVLKGGTSLMMCYGLNRFSEDIDLDSKNKNKIGKLVEEFCKRNNFTYRIAKNTDTTQRYYINYGNNSRPLKVEVSFRKKEIDNRDCTFINGIKVYNIDELCRMKCIAYNARDKIRDLYDVTFICNNYWNVLSNDVKKTVQNCFEYKGIEQFDYLINTQEDELIDKDKLAEEFLRAYEKSELVVPQEKKTMSKEEMKQFVNESKKQKEHSSRDKMINNISKTKSNNERGR